jgi:hypothetical protein
MAIGSAPGVAAMATLVRITTGSPRRSVVDAALVSDAPSSPPPHAPTRSTPTRTSTTDLRMTAPFEL